MDHGVNPTAKTVIGVSTRSKGISKHVKKDVESIGGLAGGNKDIDDILDLIAPDPAP